ncbi:MAG: hypothetical protein WCQ80_02315 [Bacilli bacterium]
MNIIITAFSGFNHLATNSSQEVLRLLSQDYQTFLLPVSYDKAATHIREIIKVHKPDALVCMGQAGKTSKVRLEYNAYNEAHATICDEDGIKMYHWPFSSAGVASCQTPFPLLEWVQSFQEDDLIVSTDPGRFVCNSTYYQALSIMEKVLFIHLPYYKGQIEGEVGLPLEHMVYLVQKIIDKIR